MKANEMAKEYLDLLQKTSSGDAPSLEDFEISYALTTAEEEFIKTRYNYKSNNKREGFENSEKRRKDLAQLVTNVKITNSDINSSSFFNSENNKPNGTFWPLPENLLWVINEEIVWDKTGCYEDVRIDVKPVEHDRYNILVRNTFTKPCDRLVYRLDYSSDFDINNTSSVTIKGNPYITFPAGVHTFEFTSTIYGVVEISFSTTSIIDALVSLQTELENNYPLLNTNLFISYLSLQISDPSGGPISVDITDPTGGTSSVFTTEVPQYPIHELITHGWNIKEYHVRYIKSPSGINVDFDTVTNQVHSVLNPSTHREIIALAVKNTLASLQDPRYQIAVQDNLNKE